MARKKRFVRRPKERYASDLTILKAARKWLTNMNHWTTGQRFDRDNRTCAVGAVEKYAKNEAVQRHAEKLLDRASRSCWRRGIVSVNDKARTPMTHKRVLKAFDKAIKNEEKRLAKKASA